MQVLKNAFSRKILFFLFFILYDLIFFFPLFFPKVKMIITPEIGGGDTVTIYYPFFKFAAESLHKLNWPFWSKNIGLGYPLYAEGQIGFFNPINIFTNLFFNYLTAFNIQIVIYVFIAQIGCLYLMEELNLKTMAGFYMGITFPFVPVLVMNFMQPVLIYPIYFLPIILFSLIKILKRQTFLNYLFFSFLLFFQLLISHYQSFFMSFIFLFIFIVFYFFYIRKDNKEKIRIIFIFLLSYLTAFFLAGFQMIPAIEFFINSDRFNQNTGVIFDQNFTFKHLLTLFNPYYFGDPKIGSYDFNSVHPWEGILFIFYTPLFFLFIALFFAKNIKKNKFFFILLLSFLILILITLGKNSPLYFIFSLPIFSSFKFPSRFIFVGIYLLVLLSVFGFDFCLKHIKNIKIKYAFLILIISLIFTESYLYFYRFHVLFREDKIYTPTEITKILSKQKNNRVFSSYINRNIIINNYFDKGYKSQPDYYYNVANELLIGNISSIYGISSLTTKLGPNIRRFPYYYSLLYEDYNSAQKVVSLSAAIKNALNIAGVDYLISAVPITSTNKDIKLVKKYLNKENRLTIYLYQNLNSKSRYQFYDKVKFINTLTDFYTVMKSENLNDYALVENVDIINKIGSNKSTGDVGQNVKVNLDNNTHLQLQTITYKDSLFVLADNYYPGWAAYIDGKKTIIHRVNFLFRGILLPKGQHQIEFVYEPKSFFNGMALSLSSFIFIILGRFVYKRFANINR